MRLRAALCVMRGLSFNRKYFNHNQLGSQPQLTQHGDVPDAARSKVQQEQGFATGISRPQPAQHQDAPGAPSPEAQQEQGFATGISRPQPAQHGDVAGAARSEAQQEQGFATGISRPQHSPALVLSEMRSSGPRRRVRSTIAEVKLFQYY
jgi:hypothetical protein